MNNQHGFKKSFAVIGLVSSVLIGFSSVAYAKESQSNTSKNANTNLYNNSIANNRYDASKHQRVSYSSIKVPDVSGSKLPLLQQVQIAPESFENKDLSISTTVLRKMQDAGGGQYWFVSLIDSKNNKISGYSDVPFVVDRETALEINDSFKRGETSAQKELKVRIIKNAASSAKPYMAYIYSVSDS